MRQDHCSVQLQNPLELKDTNPMKEPIMLTVI